jgi:hypothetical protein
VIVNDLHIMRITLFPNEANPPLVVDPDAMLSTAVPFKSFQPIARWHLQVLHRPGAMEIQ